MKFLKKKIDLEVEQRRNVDEFVLVFGFSLDREWIEVAETERWGKKKIWGNVLRDPPLMRCHLIIGCA